MGAAVNWALRGGIQIKDYVSLIWLWELQSGYDDFRVVSKVSE